LAFMFEENWQYVGEFYETTIGLDADFHLLQHSDHVYYEKEEVRADFIPRQKFAHKNTFGHAHIMAGSKGKMGAAILSSRAAMREGAGLVTTSTPACGLDILQAARPEAMCQVDTSTDVLSTSAYDKKFTSSAIGPGTGQAPERVLML